MPPDIPMPTIYLCNHFTLKGGRIQDFLQGKEALLKNTKGVWSLIAACGQRLVLGDTAIPEPAMPMMQIWRLEQMETLYTCVYRFSETGWYRRLGDSLASERQELSFGVLGGDSVRDGPRWRTRDDPGYCYFFEEALPKQGEIHAYLRELNWFSAHFEKQGWRRVWTASQLTAAPSLISVLWKVPGDVEQIERTLRSVTSVNPKRYELMCNRLQRLSRKRFYPIFSEWLASQIRMDESIPISPLAAARR